MTPNGFVARVATKSGPKHIQQRAEPIPSNFPLAWLAAPLLTGPCRRAPPSLLSSPPPEPAV